MEPKGCRDLLPAWALNRRPLDRENNTPTCPDQKWHGKEDCTGRLGAAVSGDHNRIAQRCWFRGQGRHDQHGPAAVEESRLHGCHTRLVAARTRSAQDHQIERTTATAESIIVDEFIPVPAIAKPIRLFGTGRDGVCGHHSFELLMGLRDPFPPVDWVEERQCPDIRHKNIRNAGPRGYAFDVAVKDSSNDEDRPKDGATRVSFDGNKNSLHVRHPNSKTLRSSLHPSAADPKRCGGPGSGP